MTRVSRRLRFWTSGNCASRESYSNEFTIGLEVMGVYFFEKCSAKGGDGRGFGDEGLLCCRSQRRP